jgi:hypothetical protein
MKISKLVLGSLFLSQVTFAYTGALFDPAIKKLVASEQIGQATVFVNGKKKAIAARECALLITDFATEAFDRDVLTIGFSGNPLSNNYGVNPHGQTVKGKLLWDGPLFYDPTGGEKRVKQDGMTGFTFCNAESQTAFAGECNNEPGKRTWKYTVLISKQASQIVEVFTDAKGKATETKVVCQY